MFCEDCGCYKHYGYCACDGEWVERFVPVDDDKPTDLITKRCVCQTTDGIVVITMPRWKWEKIVGESAVFSKNREVQS